jgi:hypothetical protein
MFSKDDQEKMMAASFYPLFEAFFKGNIESRTYEQYEHYRPMAIEAGNEQTRALLIIQALVFNLIDLGLYLDTHPNSNEAFELFKKYQNELRPLMKDYESKYGPFTLKSEAFDKLPWEWIKGPWPWEN